MMNWATGTAVYFVVWWLTLLVILPFGVRPVEKEDLNEGGDPGSPAKPRLLLKVLITSVVAGVIVGIIYWIQTLGLISFRY